MRVNETLKINRWNKVYIDRYLKSKEHGKVSKKWALKSLNFKNNDLKCSEQNVSNYETMGSTSKQSFRRQRKSMEAVMNKELFAKVDQYIEKMKKF